MGQRFFSVFADYFDFASAELVKMKNEFDLLKLSLGKGYLYTVILDEDDYFVFDIAAGGSRVWTYHTSVTGTHPSLGAILLDRVEDVADLLWGVPDRIEAQATTAVANYQIYDSTTNTINDIAYPERITVVVSNSTNYRLRTQYSDRLFSGRYLVVIEGRDINDIEVIEHLQVRDDGVFLTQNIFKSISSVVSEGFDGDVNLYLTTATDHIVDPYNIAVITDLEGPLHLSVFNLAPSSTAYLKHFTDRFKLGRDYRRGTTPAVENEETSWEQALLDSLDASYTAVDIAINPDSTRLYCVDSSGFIHIYNHGVSTFTPTSQTDVTLESSVVLQPLMHYARLDETFKIFTWHQQLREAIVGVTIRRIDPAGLVEYLQADKSTWSASVYEFLTGASLAALPEDSWRDFDFDVTFDQLGKWEFYSITRTGVETFTAYTAVLADSLTALISMDSGVANPSSIYFSETGELCISDATTVYRFTEHKDCYLAAEAAQTLIIRENYDDLVVVL
jgi:hypothetical protein